MSLMLLVGLVIVVRKTDSRSKETRSSSDSGDAGTALVMLMDSESLPVR